MISCVPGSLPEPWYTSCPLQQLAANLLLPHTYTPLQDQGARGSTPAEGAAGSTATQAPHRASGTHKGRPAGVGGEEEGGVDDHDEVWEDEQAGVAVRRPDGRCGHQIQLGWGTSKSAGA